MAQVVSASAAETNVVLPRTPSQDAMNNVIEQAPSQASVGAAVPQPGPATPEEMAKEVTWHDHHGMDLTQVREFEPRCVIAASRPSLPPRP